MINGRYNKILNINFEMNKNNIELKESAELRGDAFLKEVANALKKNKMAVIGLIVIIFLMLIAIFAPYIAPYDPYDVNLDLQFSKPSIINWFGTDMFGRDILSRIIFGTRISMLIGLIPTFISMVIGIILGLFSGYYGGKIDSIIMRIADIVLAFPSLLLAMVFMYTLGASLLNIFIALSLVSWAGISRVVRSQTLSLKEMEFIEASKSIGTKNWTIMIRHIFPNCIPNLIVLFTLNIPGAILSESSLSFLGVGAQPPTPSWGLEISRGKEYLLSAPWVSIFPGVMILIITLAFNFFGDGLRDALDPYMKY
jgi:ABC-type dipeptide/oligopeptide/nickel transport system permease subunit